MTGQKTILIIEDEISHVNALQSRLTKNGFAVLTAMDGKDGLEKAFDQHPDLIILDIILPVMNGAVMLKKLREDDWGKTVPVLVLSNLNEQNRSYEMDNGDYSVYKVKADTTLDEVLEAVRGYVGKG